MPLKMTTNVPKQFMQLGTIRKGEHELESGIRCLDAFPQRGKDRFVQMKTLVLNVDNGPENHSRRTQFMQRLLEFVQRYQVSIRLAYYPPYHSKYNPVERCWGILEQHWNGSLLDSVDSVIQYACTGYLAHPFKNQPLCPRIAQ